jgi:chromosome segregation ATPase
MTLVEECRTLANRLLRPHSPYVAEAAAGHLRKAADEIERQAAEIERLREAIAWYSNTDPEAADAISARASTETERHNARLTAALAAAEERVQALWKERTQILHDAGGDLFDALKRTQAAEAALAAAEERFETTRDRMNYYKEQWHHASRHCTDERMRAKAAEDDLATARDDALEEAAKVAEEQGPSDPRDDWTDHAEIQDGMARRISRAIRARASSAPLEHPRLNTHDAKLGADDDTSDEKRNRNAGSGEEDVALGN